MTVLLKELKSQENVLTARLTLTASFRGRLIVLCYIFMFSDLSLDNRGIDQGYSLREIYRSGRHIEDV